ncbi:MAG: hypothetical protein AB1391_04330 [Candidatus Micrarchaeota archaeon]
MSLGLSSLAGFTRNQRIRELNRHHDKFFLDRGSQQPFIEQIKKIYSNGYRKGENGSKYEEIRSLCLSEIHGMSKFELANNFSEIVVEVWKKTIISLGLFSYLYLLYLKVLTIIQL